MTPHFTFCVRYMAFWLRHLIHPDSAPFHIVDSTIWQSFVNWESSSLYSGKKNSTWTIVHPEKLSKGKRKLAQRIIPRGFLEQGGTVLVPLNVPHMAHWFLGTIKFYTPPQPKQSPPQPKRSPVKMEKAAEQIIDINTWNTVHGWREQYDGPVAAVLANTCEHIMVRREKMRLKENPNAPPQPARKYRLLRRHCEHQSMKAGKHNACAFCTLDNMLMHFLGHECHDSMP